MYLRIACMSWNIRSISTFIHHNQTLHLWSPFGIVITVIFKSVFRMEMHRNNIFLFFKIYFWHKHIKTNLKTRKEIKLKQRKKLKFSIFSKIFLKRKNKQALSQRIHDCMTNAWTCKPRSKIDKSMLKKKFSIET
jgi:hypothetical protein